MPTPRLLPSAAILNGAVFVIGGRIESGSALSTIDILDLATNTWVNTSTQLSVARDRATTWVVGQDTLVVAGGAVNDVPQTAVEVFVFLRDGNRLSLTGPTLRSDFGQGYVSPTAMAWGANRVGFFKFGHDNVHVLDLSKGEWSTLGGFGAHAVARPFMCVFSCGNSNEVWYSNFRCKDIEGGTTDATLGVPIARWETSATSTESLVIFFGGEHADPRSPMEIFDVRTRTASRLYASEYRIGAQSATSGQYAVIWGGTKTPSGRLDIVSDAGESLC